MQEDGQLRRTKLNGWLDTLNTEEPLHLDFETTGLDAHDPDQRIVVWGIADCDGNYYAWNDCTLTLSARDYLYAWISHVELVAFNSVFDGAWLARELGEWPRIVGCSYVLYRTLTSEGHKRQSFSLEAAQEHVLGWPVDTQKAWLAEALARHKLAKARMSELAELEPVPFAWYCAVDAVASAMLWQYLQWRCLESEPESTELGVALRTAWNYHVQLQVPQFERVCVAQFEGFRVNRPELSEYAETLRTRAHDARGELSTHPLLAPHVREMEAVWYEQWQKKGYRTKKLVAKKKDEPWNSPDYWYLDTDRKPHAAWEREHGCWSHLETTWHEPATGPAKFNWNSDAQLRELLYHRVFKSWRDERFVHVQVDGAWHQLELTDEGKVEPVNKEVYGFFGEVGGLLLKLAKIQKELSYVEAYLTASERDGRLHVKLRPGATSNGRCAGG